MTSITLVAQRYWHSLRHLRPEQVYFRAWRWLRNPPVDTAPAPSLRGPSGSWTTPTDHPAKMIGPRAFRFLNLDGQVDGKADWNSPARSKLWLYNLHYFDDLTAQAAEARRPWHGALIGRWIEENPPPLGNGWEPYPTSLRIVNWTKWALAGNDLAPDWTHSLAIQSRHLLASLEWHLLGNHLLANAKALVFAGVFFESAEADKWQRQQPLALLVLLKLSWIWSMISHDSKN